MSICNSGKLVALFFLIFFTISGTRHPGVVKEKFKLMQITHGEQGHCLHNTQCFSPTDEWIVFDSRNDDTHIGRTKTISMVNTKTFAVKDLYHTRNQTVDGPGVGAASFSPTADRVVFIHGIRNADKTNPYSFTRRTGVAIDIEGPFLPAFMDARNIFPPFTKGALRGGTHAHLWSGDGRWLSFTYNDYIMEQLSKIDSSGKDLRTVGVMVPGTVDVPLDSTQENNPGGMFSVLIVEVTEHPVPGSDEVSRAFDEGWIGRNGYRKADGTWQKRAIAFQGNVKTLDGKDKTEIFVADLPNDLTVMRPGHPLEGTALTRPNVPAGITQRRITYSENGVMGPRHWLRTSGDGKMIVFLSKDKQGIIQAFSVSPNGGAITQLTFNSESIESPFNISPDGKKLAYIAGKRVCISDVVTGKVTQVTPTYNQGEEPLGSVIWSNDGTMLAFNRYIKNSENGEKYLQIFLAKQVDTVHQ